MTKVTSPAVDVLRQIPYFHGLPAATLAEVARRGLVRSVHKGADVFREGEAATGLFVVVAGRVKLVRTSPRGREQVLHTEGPGATLGEVPLFDGEGYVASAVAAEDSRLLFLPRSLVLDLCRRQPAVALGIIAVLARRLRGFAALIEDLALRDVNARLAGFLGEAARRSGSETLHLALTRDEIAARLGTVRELVSRALSQLRAQDVIDVAGRRVRIRDPRRLAELARGTAISP